MKAFDCEAVQNLAASAELKRKEAEERKICVVCRQPEAKNRFPDSIREIVLPSLKITKCFLNVIRNWPMWFNAIKLILNLYFSNDICVHCLITYILMGHLSTNIQRPILWFFNPILP